MFKKIIICILITLNIITATICWRLNIRLEQNRQLVEHYRAEFKAAQNRESDIARSIQRTGEILNSSIYTVAELRNAIREIRKNYEEMENRLYSSGGINNTNNNPVGNQKVSLDE